MSLQPAAIDPDRILTALSTSTYQALTSPRQTIADCIRVVAEAKRTASDRGLRDWIAATRTEVEPDALRECLHVVIRQAFRTNLTDEHLVLLSTLEAAMQRAFG